MAASIWPLRMLEDVLDDILDRRGVTPLKLGSSFKERGHRVISAKAIKQNRVDLTADEPRFVDDATFGRWMRTPLGVSDVILTSEAPLGEVAYLPEKVDWCLGQRLFALRAKRNVLDGQFLFYVLRSREVQQDLVGRASGTTVQGIRQSELRKVIIPVPPLEAQRAIASVLGALDDKIELNRKMCATLEAIARALFKSWFVDFDPVRAKAEGRDPGLPPEIAALFPESFEESVHHEIPSGWTFCKLLDIAMLNPETWSKMTRPNIIRYVDLSTLKRGRFETPATYEQSEAPSRAQRLLRPGDTLVGTVRPANGSYGLVSDEGLTGSTGFAVLRPTKSKPFTYLAASSKENIERLGHLADGGAYPAVRPEVVGGTRVVLPSKNVLCAFDAIATPLLDRYAQADRESRTLAALRDALLPKLISGEIRVSDAEHMLAASA